MEEKKIDTIDYRVHESILARLENVNKRLFILLIIVFTALILTNIAWIIYENQFEDTITVTQETPTGNNNYVGHDGSITNGKANDN